MADRGFWRSADPREILAKRLHLQVVTRLFAKQYCITMRVFLGAGIGEVLMRFDQSQKADSSPRYGSE
jgi:hypothetical protein